MGLHVPPANPFSGLTFRARQGVFGWFWQGHAVDE